MKDRYPASEQLLAEASADTGLSDFGGGDFRDGLDVLLDSLRRDADLHPLSDDGVIGVFRRRLVNRLEVEAWYRDHPEVAHLDVRGPVAITGLPRTGSSALGNMMSLDPQFRCLRLWEQFRIVPPPTPDTESTDPRRLQFAADNENLSTELKAIHLFELDAAVEDIDVLGMAFHNQQYTLPVFGYHAWWRQSDMTETYAYHRRVIRVLGSRRPPNLWLFKSPHHKFHLEAIVSAYPDVRFVMTHRDPAKVVPSYASTVLALYPPPRREHDLHRLGRETSAHLRIGMEHAIAARARMGEHRFIDVHHCDLIADPLGTLRRVYAFLKLDLAPAFERAVRDWQAANQVGSHGTHHYTAEQFGLSAEQIRSDYDFYIRHFGVAVGI